MANETATRIYRVDNGDAAQLVRASNPAQAIRHAAKNTFTVKVASQDDCVSLASEGVIVETAGVEDEG